ncbi:MAG TPA: LysR family transcriptional regulator [Gemmatimonadaceae bacterium]|nr:LysR family transcriptional regulator [Gemmatimonadaceae bacterium]
MNIPDLEAFIAVVETGSIGGASLRLHLTQPGVTRRVQSLEQSLGTPLLDRRSKPPRLTAAGRAAYDQARRVVQAVRDMTMALEPDGEPQGDLRVGVTAALGDLALAEPVDRMRAAYPQLHLRALTGWSEALIQSVRGGALDAAAVVTLDGRQPLAGRACEALTTDPAAIVASKDLPLPKSVRLEDLAPLPWVLDHDGCSFRRVLRDAFAATGRALVPGIEVGGAELQLSLIARGHGVGMVLPRMLERSAFGSDVRIVDVEDFRPMFTVWLIHSTYPGRLAAPIRCFRDALALGLAQGEHRVEVRGASRRKVAREDRDAGDQHGNANHDRRVGRGHEEKEAR